MKILRRVFAGWHPAEIAVVVLAIVMLGLVALGVL
jgi:hypothetical protein